MKQTTTNKHYISGTRLRCVDNGREYISMKEAAADLKIGYDTLVQKMSYKDEATVAGYHLIVVSRRSSTEQYIALSKHVRCIETGEVYPSAAVAAAKMGCYPSHIRAAARDGGGRYKVKGYRWEYVADTAATAVEAPSSQSEEVIYEHDGVKLRVNPNHVLATLFGGGTGVAYVRLDVLTRSATERKLSQAISALSKLDGAPPMHNWSSVTNYYKAEPSPLRITAVLLPYLNDCAAQKAITALSKIIRNRLPEEISEFLKASDACNEGAAFAQGCKSMAEVWDKAVSMYHRDYLRFMLAAVRRRECARFNKSGQADTALEWFNTNVFTMPDSIFHQSFSSINPFKEKEN